MSVTDWAFLLLYFYAILSSSRTMSLLFVLSTRAISCSGDSLLDQRYDVVVWVTGRMIDAFIVGYAEGRYNCYEGGKEEDEDGEILVEVVDTCS